MQCLLISYGENTLSLHLAVTPSPDSQAHVSSLYRLCFFTVTCQKKLSCSGNHHIVSVCDPDMRRWQVPAVADLSPHPVIFNLYVCLGAALSSMLVTLACTTTPTHQQLSQHPHNHLITNSSAARMHIPSARNNSVTLCD